MGQCHTDFPLSQKDNRAHMGAPCPATPAPAPAPAGFKPFEKFKKCRVCKSYVHMKGAHYCTQCAYKASTIKGTTAHTNPTWCRSLIPLQL